MFKSSCSVDGTTVVRNDIGKFVDRLLKYRVIPNDSTIGPVDPILASLGLKKPYSPFDNIKNNNCKGNISLEQGEFRSIISEEAVPINQKNKIAASVPLRVPVINKNFQMVWKNDIHVTKDTDYFNNSFTNLKNRLIDYNIDIDMFNGLSNFYITGSVVEESILKTFFHPMFIDDRELPIIIYCKMCDFAYLKNQIMKKNHDYTCSKGSPREACFHKNGIIDIEIYADSEDTLTNGYNGKMFFMKNAFRSRSVVNGKVKLDTMGRPDVINYIIPKKPIKTTKEVQISKL
jgi:hypothetical protein